MPTEQELPDVLKELAFRNGTELTHARWDSDVKLLIEDLRPYLDTPAIAAPAAQSTRVPSQEANVRPTPPAGRRPNSRSLWAAGGAAVPRRRRLDTRLPPLAGSSQCAGP